MADNTIAALLLIAINLIVSYKGFKNQAFFDSCKFEVDPILISKDYKRLLASGFLHLDWIHLFFNMLTLYLFSTTLESYIGAVPLLLIYFVSLLGGNLFTLLVHREHGDYSAVGASGAVSGIVFASIGLFPHLNMGFFFLPFSIPAWIYGLAYMAYSIYGIRSQKDNIGHEAHLGGALIGMITALFIVPSALESNYRAILLITVPAILFIYIIVSRPHLLFIDNHFFKSHKTYYDIDDHYNDDRVGRQKQIDRILDKISSKGISSLNSKEKKILDQYSEKIR